MSSITPAAGGSRRIDLNCDLGEGYGAYTVGRDEELIRLVSSANIACGFHAGDPHIMRRTVELCLKHGTAIGAHPGLPDRLGFGRRAMDVTAGEIYDFTVYQIGALDAFVRAAGGRLRHVKPHGALYHMANRSGEAADAISRAAADVDADLILFAQSGSLLLAAGRRAGLRTAAEVFADRRYGPDGSLVPRTEAGAVLTAAEAAAQAVSLALAGAPRAGESALRLEADTICVHGDGPEAVGVASAIRSALLDKGIAIGI